MPYKKPPYYAGGKSVVVRIRMSVAANKKLRAAGRAAGVRYNIIGRISEQYVDMIVAQVTAHGLPRGEGRLSTEQVKSIRRSKDKRIAVAAEHGISEGLVCAIRARTYYKWVR